MRGLMEQIGSLFTGNDGIVSVSPADMLMGTLPHPRNDDDGDEEQGFYEVSYSGEEEENDGSYYSDDDNGPAETQEEARKRYATELVQYVEYHLQRPIRYDTDLFTNLSQTETNDWHIPHDHVFADLLNYHFETHEDQASALLFDDNAYETFFIYRYEHVMLLGKEMIQWIETCGTVTLESTGRFKDVGSLRVVDNQRMEEEEEEVDGAMDMNEIVVDQKDHDHSDNDKGKEDVDHATTTTVTTTTTNTTATSTGIVTPVSAIINKPEQGRRVMFSLRQFWAEDDNFKNVSLGMFKTVVLPHDDDDETTRMAMTNELLVNMYAFKMIKEKENDVVSKKTRIQLQIYPGSPNKTLYPFENTKEWLGVFFLSPIDNVEKNNNDWTVKFITSTICNDIYVYFPPDDMEGYIVVLVRPFDTTLSEMQQSVVAAIESIINQC